MGDPTTAPTPPQSRLLLHRSCEMISASLSAKFVGFITEDWKAKTSASSTRGVGVCICLSVNPGRSEGELATKCVCGGEATGRWLGISAHFCLPD